MADFSLLPRRNAPENPYGTAGLFMLLLGVLGIVSFVSTALAETTGVTLLLIAALRALFMVRSGVRPRTHEPLPRVSLILWGVYLTALLCSAASAGGPVFSHGGLLWHPLLFPAALLVPFERRDLKTAGVLFVLGGTASGAAAVTLNALRHHGGAPFAFTGLTTFADLLVLSGVTAISFLFPLVRGKPPVWGFLLPCIVTAAALVWSAERTPVAAFAAAGGVIAARAGPRPLAAWVLVLFACLLAGPPAISYKTDWLIQGRPVDRYVVWEEALKAAPGTPLFGFGSGSFAQVLPAGAWGRFINRPPSSWHNDMLETWLDSGPVAAGAFAGLLILGIMSAVRRGISGGSGGTAPPGEPGLLFLCLAGFGLVGSVVTTSVLGMAFWLLLGLTLNYGRVSRAAGVPVAARDAPRPAQAGEAPPFS